MDVMDVGAMRPVFILPLIPLLGLMAFCGCDKKQKTELPAEHVARARTFVQFMVGKDFVSAYQAFDATMRKALPEAKLGEVWSSVREQVGDFAEVVKTRKLRHEKYDIVILTCKFANGALDVRVVFDPEGRVSGLFFAPAQLEVDYKQPAYVNRSSFQEREVRFGDESWQLPGTLSLPKGKGPFPAVVLVHGSGPQDRDETVGANMPFRDLAWGLASRGIAVLRYEKRTKEHASRMAAFRYTITTKEETTDDALHAAAALRKTKEVDPRRVFVLGHSLGGMLLPRVGFIDPDLAGLIVLAGTTRSLEVVILEQSTYLASLDGDLSDAERTALNRLKTQVAKVKKLKPGDVTAPDELPLGLPASYWLDLRDYHPPTAARTLAHPMLILQGGRDYQVTRDDFEGWKKALSGRDNVSFKVYPVLNHLFIGGSGKSRPAEYQVAGHVAVEVIEDIADWIRRKRPRQE
jgi:dienelactone hydrolase